METLTVTGIELEDKNPAQLITTITSKARFRSCAIAGKYTPPPPPPPAPKKFADQSSQNFQRLQSFR
jgi:hypothetical protein